MSPERTSPSTAAWSRPCEGLARWRCHPVGDLRRLVWLAHRADTVEPLLVAFGDAFGLPEVLLPGCDDEPLLDPPGVGRVLPDPPRAPPGPAPAEPRVTEFRQHLTGEPVARVVLDRDQHRPAGLVAVGDVRSRPVSGRKQVLGRNRLELVAP